MFLGMCELDEFSTASETDAILVFTPGHEHGKLLEELSAQRRTWGVVDCSAPGSVEDLCEKIRAKWPSRRLVFFVPPELGLREDASAPRAPRIRLEVLSGQVYCNGQKSNLSDGSYQLVAALALAGAPVSRDVLCEQLWNSMDYASARNALKMCVRRTRAQLGEFSAIRFENNAYALSSSATDYHEIQSTVDELLPKPLTDEGRSRLDAILRALCNTTHGNRLLSYAWFAPYAHRLDTWRREVAKRLADDALARNDQYAVLDVARHLLEANPQDPLASELNARAERAAVLRH